MATREELMRQFMLDQKNVIADNEAREQRKNSSVKKFNSEDEIKTINLVVPSNESSRTYTGYFVTDPEDKFIRRISNIRMTGCNGKAYKTIGLRTMDLNNYSDQLDQESKDLIIRFNNLWDRFDGYSKIPGAYSEVTKIQDESGNWVQDKNFFEKKYSNMDICYMYLTSGPGVDEPGYYLVQCKSLQFQLAKANMVNKQIKFLKQNGMDPTSFAVEMSDNTAPKKRLITIKITRPSGYQFDFDTDLLDSEFTLPIDGLSKLKPLSEMYISEKSIDKDAFKTNINIVASWVSKLESQSQVSTAKAKVEAQNDPFAD